MGLAVYHLDEFSVCISCKNNLLVSLHLTDAKVPENDPAPSPFSDFVFTQLQEYWNGQRQTFDLPFLLQGTPFEKHVFQAVSTIPYGETRSYGDIARLLHSPGAARAVGRALHMNPVWLVIPCHRVICSDGSPGGYAGGVKLKRKLLALEASNKKGVNTLHWYLQQAL